MLLFKYKSIGYVKIFRPVLPGTKLDYTINKQMNLLKVFEIIKLEKQNDLFSM